MVHLLLVFAGATVGTGLRIAVGLALAPNDELWATLIVNLTGSFALGVVVSWLAGQRVRASWRQPLRLLFGTGLLGGFTTYSALALAVSDLGNGDTIWRVLYGLGTVVGGAFLAFLGATLSRRLAGRTVS